MNQLSHDDFLFYVLLGCANFLVLGVIELLLEYRQRRKDRAAAPCSDHDEGKH
jgi:hypothetical protein